jgi:DivIVA domain-containing protein
MSGMITAAEVLAAKFQSTKFTEGYDQDEVDDFLDRVVATLRAREGGAPADRPVTVGDLDAPAFTTTKFREGYAQDDVHALLARVRVALGGAPSAPAIVPPERTAPEVGPVVEERRGFWRRLFGG